MGFVQPGDKPEDGLNEKIERTAVEAARRKFSPEFMNRLDKLWCFTRCKRTQLEQVLEIELEHVQKRVLQTAKGQFLFRVTGAGREFLLQEGTDQRYGARHLKRAIERHVVYPLANLLATEQVQLGDLVCIDWNSEQNGLTFVREGENLAMPARRPEPVPVRVRRRRAMGARWRRLRWRLVLSRCRGWLVKNESLQNRLARADLLPGRFIFQGLGRCDESKTVPAVMKTEEACAIHRREIPPLRKPTTSQERS